MAFPFTVAYPPILHALLHRIAQPTLEVSTETARSSHSRTCNRCSISSLRRLNSSACNNSGHFSAKTCVGTEGRGEFPDTN